MRRGCTILASACLLLVLGCRDYDFRLGQTLEEMRYQQRLEKNLEKAPTKGRLQQDLIYVRPPKGMSGPTKAFTLAVLETGKFDVSDSFIDESKQASLHVVARHKKPKAPPKKGVAAAPDVPRGDFTAEVIDMVKTAYGVEDLTPAKLKLVSKKHAGRENSYKEAKLNLNTKEVSIYLYGTVDKTSPYNVALIFEYPKAEAATLSSKINLSLEAFAVGEPANRAFSGGSPEESGGQEGADSGQAVPI
jgi:hypothetical protein